MSVIPPGTGVRKRRAILKARAAGHASVTNGRGASVLADQLQHGGYRGAVGGGYANSKPATKKENAAFVKAQRARKRAGVQLNASAETAQRLDRKRHGSAGIHNLRTSVARAAALSGRRTRMGA